MTTWNPGDGGPDLLSSGDEGPPWADRARTAAVAVVCLVAGAFLGTRLDDAGSPFAAHAAQSPAALTGGVVSAVVDPDDPMPHQFRVSLFNPGEREVRVRVVGLTGWSTAVVAARAVDVQPRSWARAAFSLPDACEEPTPPTPTAVRIRIVDPQPAGEQRLELAGPANAIRDDHELECPAATPLASSQLTGLWYVETARGRWAGFAGTALTRFTSDGRFAFDPEGRMFDEGNQGVLGTYRLDGSRLRLRADGGYACDVGYSEVWTTTLLGEGRLRLDIVRSDAGYCSSPPGERQILRRLVIGSRLPPVAALSER